MPTDGAQLASVLEHKFKAALCKHADCAALFESISYNMLSALSDQKQSWVV